MVQQDIYGAKYVRIYIVYNTYVNAIKPTHMALISNYNVRYTDHDFNHDVFMHVQLYNRICQKGNMLFCEIISKSPQVGVFTCLLKSRVANMTCRWSIHSQHDVPMVYTQDIWLQ